MSIIQFDDSKVSGTVLALTKNAKGYLDSASNAFSGIKVPSDFSKGYVVKNATTKISEIKKNINSINTQINDTIKRFEEANRKNNAIAQDLNSILASLSGFGTYMDRNDAIETTDRVKENMLKGIFNILNFEIGLDSTITNAKFAFAKGVANVGESLVDGVATLTSALACKIKMDPQRREEIMKDTMTFVGTEYVNNFFYKFYNSKAGQAIDKTAFSPFKSTGLVNKIIEGIGYITGIAAGASAIGAPISILAGVAGTGKGSENYWSSELSKPDSERKSTVKTFWTGVGQGIANGLWEAIQFKTGTKIQEVTPFSIPAANAAMRVFIDAGFNSMDTPYKATATIVLDSIISGKLSPVEDWKKEFEKLGGWDAVIKDYYVGLIGSAAGEAINWKQTKVQTALMKQNKTIIRYDDGVGHKKEISIKKLREFLYDELEPNGVLKNTNYISPDNYFYRNQTTPNEMTYAALEYLKRGKMTREELEKTVLFVVRYHSSLDPISTQIDNWVNSELATEIVDYYGNNIAEDLIIPVSREQKINIVSERVKKTRFYTEEEFSLMQKLGLFSKEAMGFNHRGEYSIIKTFSENSDYVKAFSKYTYMEPKEVAENITKDIVFHENLHQISANGNNDTGVKYHGSFTGLNEAITELLTEARPESFYKKTRTIYFRVFSRSTCFGKLDN